MTEYIPCHSVRARRCVDGGQMGIPDKRQVSVEGGGIVRICMVAAMALLASALTGCSDFKGWHYEADARIVRVPLLAKRVVVPPLDDLRPYGNSETG